MRSARQRVGSRLLWLAVVLVVVAIAFCLRPRPAGTKKPITQATFDEIHLGMRQAELLEMLGKPDFETAELGKVNGPESYSLNFSQSEAERRARGYEDYHRRQWTSSAITIIVITDAKGAVVCRYSGEGNRVSWWRAVRAWLLPWWG